MRKNIKRHNKLNAKKVGENTVIDNSSIHSSSEESKERGVKPNKPLNKRGKGNTKTIPYENNLNGNFGIQNNRYDPGWQNNQDVRNQENTKRPYGNQRIRPNQIQSKPVTFNDWRNGRNQNLNVDSSDGGKKVTRTPGKRVKYNGDNGLPSSQSNAPKSMTFNNSNNTGYATYNQGGVNINFRNGAMMINGKKVPGLKANVEAVIEYGKGELKVNGVSQAVFDGIQGCGRIVVLGDSFSHTVYDEDEDSRIGQGFTNLGNISRKKPKYQNNNFMTNTGNNNTGNINSGLNNIGNINSGLNNMGNINTGNNISHIGGASFGNNYNGRKRPAGMVNVPMGNGGMIAGGPNGLQVGNGRVKIGGPNGVQVGNGGMKIGGPNGVQVGNGGMKIGGPNGIAIGPNGMNFGNLFGNWWK
ncbi:putative uncharacterized protein DDB_G0286901 [Adelges cooleyi]|uniref:putative uncharacterized protein DDB_G0286901 n=1 Tax=Adelges cooleyi TaxID=133065 RepID=UPI00217F699D|nr:putative uncharacterized protein DDB_G0286901 [Adelges cooleyi]